MGITMSTRLLATTWTMAKAAYATKVVKASQEGSLPIDARPHECFECGWSLRQPGIENKHVILLIEAAPLAEDEPSHEDEEIVLIGCEGYWQINPNLVGISAPNWTWPYGTTPAGQF